MSPTPYMVRCVVTILWPDQYKIASSGPAIMNIAITYY